VTEDAREEAPTEELREKRAPMEEHCHHCNREAVMYLTVATRTRLLCEHHALEMLNRWRPKRG
jgi:hypothetical protein